MMKVVEVKELQRDFDKKTGILRKKKERITAVKGLSFSVNKGEIFGLLGQNGAGKTTTIKMLITLLAPTSGTCKVLGKDVYKDANDIRKKINFIFGGELGVYRRLSARDNLLYFAGLYKLPDSVAETKVQELLELVNLSKDADRLVETYSKGMIQRLQIARGLINDPEIIFMDEPTIGLDPIGAQMLHNIILGLKEKGCTVLLTTHYMYEADELCDRVAIMNHGELIALDTPANMKSKYSLNKDQSLEEVYIQLIQYNESNREGKGGEGV
ncbi:ABC transporter ATP-binding protein [Anaerosporobacter faecicola]|uniref:ABC transporter ATP-binding protein n=1 Tax=Anaerosporobacter faecicola TaxID=2718714 RepID=UPI001A9AA896|nr:ABC transporter ATP-binding protein [Anaerosporobacter faecicola]